MFKKKKPSIKNTASLETERSIFLFRLFNPSQIIFDATWITTATVGLIADKMQFLRKAE